MYVDDGQGLSSADHIDRLKASLTQRYENDLERCGHTTLRCNNLLIPTGAVAFDMTRHIPKMLSKLGMDNVPAALASASPTLFQTLDNTPTDQRVPAYRG
jgi:hypothetical protein